MHDAALEKDNDWIKALLSISGIRDTPGEDGLTGFAISMVLKNVEVVPIFLRSGLQPKDDMIFLAQEFLRLSPGRDLKMGILQTSIRETLTSMGIEDQTYNVSSAQYVISGNVKPDRFPFVNPDIEKKECYFKNKTWQEYELHHSIMCNNWKVMSENLQHLVLGKFCIKPTSHTHDMKWVLRRVALLPCNHQNER